MRRRQRGAAGDWLGLAPGADVLALLSPASSLDELGDLSLPAGTTVECVDEPPPRSRPRDAVVLVVRDRADLRRTVSGVPGLGTAAVVAVIFHEDVDLPPVAAQPQWPRTLSLLARVAPSPHLVLTFSEPVAARAVLIEVARSAGVSRRLAIGWPLVGVERSRPETWPAADPSARVAAPRRLLDQSVDSPPDLVLLEDAAALDRPTTNHEVLGRPTVVVGMGAEPLWKDLRAMSAEEQAVLVSRARDRLGPVDHHLFNPVGFDREVSGAPVVLSSLGPPSELAVAALRAAPGVTVDWQSGRGPFDVARDVVHLAAAGVPVVAGSPPVWALRLLGERLAESLAAPGDLADRLSREEVSIRQRRAALTTHGADAWRRDLAARHGAQQTSPPAVSVLLPTRRPEMLGFALRQVARQHDVEVELVLATHGFEPDADALAAFREGGGRLTHVPVGQDATFGAVMNEAVAAAAHGVVLKMDDDDWYGPHFVIDLLLARDYSGADVVGCPPELTYLAALDITTRSSAPTEVYRHFVAGGTIMTTREVLQEIGGFRDTVRYVDANLLAAVSASGGSIYRSHGLGYVLRRAAAGHTWDPGLAYFLGPERAREQWRGFRPSVVLAADALDLPAPPPEDGG